ncbi:MAG: lipase family protein [Planctomycetaceae bacterium]|nr:lipase family protein [Planctomycetaceae bacterium]
MMSETESVMQVVSRVAGPIEQMPAMHRSLLFAELAGASYYDEHHAAALITEIGFTACRFFDRDGAQAYIFQNDTDCVVACRGTEPHEWNDIKADANAVAVLTETLGKVHRGFNQEVDDLWPMLEEALEQNTKTLWFTGHSLGGAMATICAGRCYYSEIQSMPRALYTFGSPRVGDKQFVNYVKLDHTRWVNNNDIVTRVPPAWMGYRHGGKEMYLNRNGHLRRVSGWTRTVDRLRGFLMGLARFQIDHFADHSIDRYIESIRRIAPETSQAVEETKKENS